MFVPSAVQNTTSAQINRPSRQIIACKFSSSVQVSIHPAAGPVP